MQFWDCDMDGFVKEDSGAHSGLWGNRKYLQIKTREKLSEKLLCGVCIPLRELYLFSHKAVFEHWPCKTKKVISRSPLKSMAKNVISSNKTPKETFPETALCYVHSFHRVKAYFTWSSLETLSLRYLGRHIKWRLKAYGVKGNVFWWKLERSFQSNCFVVCVFIS